MIGLMDIVSALREELASVKEELKSSSSTFRFSLEEIEIELQTVLTKEDSKDAGVKVSFWVLESSVEASEIQTRSNIQTIKFKLKPEDTSNKDGKTNLRKNMGNSTVRAGQMTK